MEGGGVRSWFACGLGDVGCQGFMEFLARGGDFDCFAAVSFGGGGWGGRAHARGPMNVRTQMAMGRRSMGMGMGMGGRPSAMGGDAPWRGDGEEEWLEGLDQILGSFRQQVSLFTTSPFFF